MNSEGGDFQASKPKQCWRTEDEGGSFSSPFEGSTWTLCILTNVLRLCLKRVILGRGDEPRNQEAN